MKETIDNIKSYLSIINKSAVKIDSTLIDFTIGEVLDRVQIYLNTDTIPKQLERIVAKIVNTGLNKCLKEIEMSKDGQVVDRAISSISDNGQSISYSNEVTKYFTSATDEELFTGFSSLLNRYRRVKVVHSRVNEEGNSQHFLR